MSNPRYSANAGQRRGIVLAGGTGTRLHPLTIAVSKQLLPVYDKPMIYYPICTLMAAGIREVLVITTPRDEPAFRSLLGDGGQWGLQIEYAVQPEPRGIAEAFHIGKAFLDGHPAALILGDNLFHGAGLAEVLREANAAEGAAVFGCRVRDPERYGVAEFGPSGTISRIHEKPAEPPSPYAITGLYFYDADVCDVVAQLEPSSRGELEITDLNNLYLRKGRLRFRALPRGMAWLDTGTHESLLAAGEFIRTIELRQDLKIGCPEQVALEQGWIERAELRSQARRLAKSGYGAYLEDLLAEMAA